MIVPIVKCTKIDPLPKYTYSGTAPRFKHDDSGNWEIAFTGDCNITFSRILQNIDVFVVAGGRAGGSGDGSGRQGGNGGKGGGAANGVNIQVFPQMENKIHVGQSDQDSFAFSVTAFSGAGASGGVGGKVVDGNATAASAGTAGVYALISRIRRKSTRCSGTDISTALVVAAVGALSAIQQRQPPSVVWAGS